MSDISGAGSGARKLDQGYALKEKPGEVSQAKLKEVSDMYEKYFIKEMIKQMKSTISEGTGIFKKNNAEKIFQEQLDDEYSSEWNKQGSFGLSQMILEQLNQRFGTGPQGANSKNPIEKPAGPIELNDKTNIKKINSLNEFSLQINPEAVLSYHVVKNPWAGTLQNKELIEGDRTAYRIKHDNGLESLITIHGAASENTRFLSKGDHLQAGDELGLAAPTSPLFWTVRSNLKGV